MTDLDKDGNQNGNSMEDAAEVLRCETFLTERLFFVRWKNPHLKDSWVGENRLQSRQDLLQKYFAEHPEKSQSDSNDVFSSTSETTDDVAPNPIESTDDFTEEEEAVLKNIRKTRLTSRRSMAKRNTPKQKTSETIQKPINTRKSVIEINSESSELDGEEIAPQIPKTQPVKRSPSRKPAVKVKTQINEQKEFNIHFTPKTNYQHAKKPSKIVSFSGELPPPEKSGTFGGKIVDIVPSDSGYVTEIQLPDQPFTKVMNLQLTRYIYPKEICDFLFEKVSKE